MTNHGRLGTWTAALLGGLAMSATCAAPQQPPQQEHLVRAVSSPKRLGPSEYLSPAVRDILRRRMSSHAQQMRDLMVAIMVLDYPLIGENAQRIADDANLSRPLTGDATELNAALPEKFFLHQDELRAEARALADASRALDSSRVAGSYGRLSEACVHCHAVYRKGP